MSLHGRKLAPIAFEFLVLSRRAAAISAAVGLIPGIGLHALPQRGPILILSIIFGVPGLFVLLIWWGFEMLSGTCGSEALVGLTKFYLVLIIGMLVYGFSTSAIFSRRYDVT